MGSSNGKQNDETENKRRRNFRRILHLASRHTNNLSLPRSNSGLNQYCHEFQGVQQDMSVFNVIQLDINEQTSTDPLPTDMNQSSSSSSRTPSKTFQFSDQSIFGKFFFFHVRWIIQRYEQRSWWTDRIPYDNEVGKFKNSIEIIILSFLFLN